MNKLALIDSVADELRDALTQSLCRNSLHFFVRRFWRVVEPPSRPFVDGWHLKWLCRELEAITEGRTLRLLANVPPGAMKSLLVNVFWPAWEWGPRGLPAMRYILASYSQGLMVRDNRRFTAVITDPEYLRLWPHARIDPNRTSVENLGNLRTGWRIATSPGGIGTGERADRVLVDDPHSVQTAESETMRNATIHWWREVIPTRLNDPQLSAIVVIMQRVHEADVSGDILEHGDGWTHVMIPMRYDPERHCATEHGEDPRTEPGELYWPERFPDWTVARDAKILGRWGVAAQFQQEPAPRGGGIILRDAWQPWPPKGDEERWTDEADGRIAFPPWEFVCAYLDTAFTSKDENAWCAFTRWGVFALHGVPKVMMAQAWRDRPSLQGLVTRVVDSCRRGKVDALVIENRAGAEWVRQEIQRQMRAGEWVIILDEPRGDKVARLHSVSPLFEDGVIYAPDTQWADMVIDEVATFPRGRWKDLTDTVSGALGYLRRGGLIKLELEHEQDERDSRLWRGRRISVAEEYES